MRIFAIRDESAETQKDLAYLLYYELEKRFYIELPEGADPWELPLLLDSFVKQNETTINSYWSKIWEMIWKRWCAYEDFCNSR